jgi:ATP-binding cassette subfamily C (CFTR/MRP) protein 1
MKIRNALVATIYAKCLVMGSAARKSFTTGQITTLFTQDTMFIESLFNHIAQLISAPCIIIIALALIYLEVGVAMFIGFAAIVATMIPLAIGFYFLTAAFQRKMKV